MKSDYASFLAGKSITAAPVGFEPLPVKAPLFEFQADIVRWSIRRGRSALIEDCGLGKGPQQLEWARQVCEYTGKPVLGSEGYVALRAGRRFVGAELKDSYYRQAVRNLTQVEHSAGLQMSLVESADVA